MWIKDHGYPKEISLSEFIDDMSVFLPSAANLVEAHSWAKSVYDASDLLMVRGGFTSRVNPFLRFPGCSRVYSIDERTSVCTTDNEFSASLYEIFRAWEAVVRSEGGTNFSLQKLFKDYGLVSGILKPSPQSATEGTELKQQLIALASIRPTMAAASVRGIYRSTLRSEYGLKYSHILSLKDERDLVLKGSSAIDELRARFFRILSPINMFPTPKPSAYNHASSLPLTQNDVGETFQLAFAAKVRTIIETITGGSTCWEEYCRLSRAPSEFSDLKALEKAAADSKRITLSIKPKSAATGPDRDPDFDNLPPALRHPLRRAR